MINNILMQEINVALLGFGNVGQSFARYIEKAGEPQDLKINIRAIADSSGALMIHSPEQIPALLAHKEAGRNLKEFAPAELMRDAQEFLKAFRRENISCVVESLPTNIKDGQPALDLLTDALSQGINVVTVDKGPL